ncbi:helix-turn-helix domain-containing protein [Desulfovibrio sp. OttesenSCG-928-A18]|nr:helix-turn-helix domain-containing protein [Desulfovibrio sp. OttesenSCG-928-A18]
MAEKQKSSDAFGVVLRAYRQERGLTLEQLSERVGVVHSFIHSLESGKKQPSFDMVLRLAAALNVRPGEFVDAVVEREAGK